MLISKIQYTNIKAPVHYAKYNANSLFELKTIDSTNKDTFVKSPSFKAAIHDYAKEGNLEGVVGELAAGVNINCADSNGDTPLSKACYWNQVNIVEYLLKQRGVDVNIQNKLGYTAIHKALYDGVDSIMDALLALDDINLTLRDCDGELPLDFANKFYTDKTWYNKLKELTESQLQRIGSSTDTYNTGAGSTTIQKQPVDICKLSHEENIWTKEEISNAFLELVGICAFDRAATMLENTPLIDFEISDRKILRAVCSTGNPDFAEKVFDYKFHKQGQMQAEYDAKRKEFLEKTINKLSYDDLKANMFATNTVDGFKVLMTKPEFNPNDVVDKISLFERACILDSEGNLAKAILSKYGNVKTSNASKTRNSVIKDLIKNYEEIGKYKIIMNQIEDKAFVQSEREAAAAELQKLMESEDFKPEIVDSVGNTVLHIAATLPVDSGQKLIGMAIDKGIDKNAGNVAGQTALMSAVKALVKSDKNDKAGRTNLLANIKFLLDKGVNIDAQDNSGKTAFHFACMGTVAALLELLITKTPNVLLLDKTNMRACAMLKTPEMKQIYNEYIGAV